MPERKMPLSSNDLLFPTCAGSGHGKRGHVVVMNDIYDIVRNRQTRLGMILMLIMLLVMNVVPAQARHGYRRSHIWIAARVVVSVVPLWAPYAHTYPPVVVAPPPRVYV
jgi:hypothetical protein